jgi:hypothetical protein
VIARAAVILLFALFAGCAGPREIGEGEPSFNQSEKNYAGPLDINSPEGLALVSSTMYLDMINGKLDPQEAFPELLEYSSRASRNAMESMVKQFADNVRSSRDFFESRKLRIKGYTYSETVYSGGDKASIYRIQIMNNGHNYYFKQDFVLEEGAWKIKGDNICDPFKIILNGKR